MECSICFASLLDEVPEPQLSGPQAKKRKTERPQMTDRNPDICCTPCGHLFHRACLLSWFNHKSNQSSSRHGTRHPNTRGTCPRCRSKASVHQLYPVFFDPDKDASTSKSECSLEKCQNIRKCYNDLNTQFLDLQRQVKVERERAQTSEAKLNSLLAAKSGGTGGAKPRSTKASTVPIASSSSRRTRKWSENKKSEADTKTYSRLYRNDATNSDDEDEFTSCESDFSDDDFDNYYNFNSK